jgi:hypothetical protein
MPTFPDISTFRTLTETDQQMLPKVILTICEDLPFSEQCCIFQIVLPHVQQYVLYRQVTGREANADISAMKKGKKMAKEAVLALSFSGGGHNGDDDDTVFFTGIVAVEMSHCECPAERGPHSTCNHIVCVLLVLVRFVVTGDLSFVKSCTEELQTFKKPGKLYSGAPVPAEKMGPGTLYYTYICMTMVILGSPTVPQSDIVFVAGSSGTPRPNCLKKLFAVVFVAFMCQRRRRPTSTSV